MRAFDQIVTQDRVAGKTISEKLLKRFDLVDSLPRIDSSSKQVLIDVGNRPRVNVVARVSGVNPRQPRAPRRSYADRYTRLKDRVAFDNPTAFRVDHRPI